MVEMTALPIVMADTKDSVRFCLVDGEKDTKQRIAKK